MNHIRIDQTNGSPVQISMDVFNLAELLFEQANGSPDDWSTAVFNFMTASAIVGDRPDGTIAIFHGIEHLKAEARGEAAPYILFRMPIDPAPDCQDLELLAWLCREYKGGDCLGKETTEKSGPGACSSMWERWAKG